MSTGTTGYTLLAVAAVALALAAGAAAGVYWLQPGGGAVPDTQAATVLDAARPLPKFELVDGRGEAFDRERLTGAWHLLFFGFTHCPDVCPTTLSKLAAVKDALAQSGAAPEVVFVSVDPRRDDPATLHNYVSYFDPGFVGVTGSLEQLRRLTGALYLPFSYVGDTATDDYVVEHSAALVLVDPQARARAYFTPPHDASRIAMDLKRLIAG